MKLRKMMILCATAVAVIVVLGGSMVLNPQVPKECPENLYLLSPMEYSSSPNSVENNQEKDEIWSLMQTEKWQKIMFSEFEKHDVAENIEVYSSDFSLILFPDDTAIYCDSYGEGEKKEFADIYYQMPKGVFKSVSAY
ncbi:MAG: hypothetical protein RR219_04615 [Clostridiales bacterium]